MCTGGYDCVMDDDLMVRFPRGVCVYHHFSATFYALCMEVRKCTSSFWQRLQYKVFGVPPIGFTNSWSWPEAWRSCNSNSHRTLQLAKFPIRTQTMVDRQFHVRILLEEAYDVYNVPATRLSEHTGATAARKSDTCATSFPGYICSSHTRMGYSRASA
jgi:hypothetical protein